MQMQVSLGSLESFAIEFWNSAAGYTVFAWHGPLGAGKTTMIRALGHYRGVTDQISSPTFSIINAYALPAHDAFTIMYHIDLYRLVDVQEAVHAGVEDALYSGQICMVEWPEKASSLFDHNTVHIYIESTGDTLRSLRIELPNNRNL